MVVGEVWQRKGITHVLSGPGIHTCTTSRLWVNGDDDDHDDDDHIWHKHIHAKVVVMMMLFI